MAARPRCLAKSRWLAAAVAAVALLTSAPAGRSAEKPAPRSQRYALLVGVNDYQYVEPLEFCRQDMLALSKQLVASGFPAGNVFLLEDKAGDNKDRPFKGNVERQLKLVLDLLEPSDVVVLGFSGHGVSLDGKSYFCPLDARVDETASLISVDDIYQQLAASPAAFKLMLIDACRNDPRPGGRKSVKAAKEGTQKFAAPLERPPEGVVLLSSCKAGQISMEDKGFGHGVFMHFVLEGLAGKADADGDRIVSLEELYKFAGQETKTYVAHKYSDVQTPRLFGELSSEALGFDFSRLFARIDRKPVPSTPPPGSPVPAPPSGAPPAAAGKVITNSIGMKLALIPAGEFLMGSPDGEKDRQVDEKQHRVRITKPFYLGVYEVTLNDFLKFYQAANYKSRWKTQGAEWAVGLKPKNGKNTLDVGEQYVPWSWGHPDQTPQHPVVNVSWNDAVAFCEWLSQKEGKRYRLPTEAEWEYACRAGTTTRFSNGDDEEGLLAVGNVADAAFREAYDASSGAKGRDGYPFTAPVGRFKPNGFGLYDMHGNAWEWCSDWYDKEYYDTSPVDDPRGPAAGSSRVLRGGGWVNLPVVCRSGLRFRGVPAPRFYDLGFRVVCVAE